MNHLYIKDIIYRSIFLCIIYDIPESENSPRKQEKGAVVAIYIYTTNPSFSYRYCRKATSVV